MKDQDKQNPQVQRKKEAKAADSVGKKGLRIMG